MLNEVCVFIYLENDGWVPAGLLQFNEQGRSSSSIFRYGETYQKRSNAVSIDPVQLPLRDGEHESPPDFPVFNGIRDAGPDRWGRYLLEKKFLRGLNEIEYIAAAGSDRVGALGFASSPTAGPELLTPDGFKRSSDKHLDLGRCAKAVSDLDKDSDSEALREYLQYGPSLGGARPKATVLWSGKQMIAKFSMRLDKRAEPLIEYATMTLAKACGLNVPQLEITEILGRSVYLIERFDRRSDGSPIPFVSALTLAGFHESDHRQWSYLTLADQIIKFSSDPDRDCAELFKRLIFNIAVYNNDDHPRNTGFLATDRQRWDLSPLYDVVPSTVSTNTYSLAMTIGTNGKEASFSNALSMCRRFRLTQDEAQGIIDATKTIVSGWESHFRSHGVVKDDLEKLKNSFKDKP